MAYEEILYDVSGRIATVTLNRPAKLNAWTPKMEAEVQSAMDQAEKDENARVIILTGSGRGFCAGADMENLSTVAGGDASAENLKKLVKQRLAGPERPGVRADFQRTYSYFPALTKPVIAAINGPVAGLGFVIALYCDLRFASEQAKFSTSFSRRGLIAEYGMGWILPRIVGLPNALDLLFSARLIDAVEAQRMGLVNRVWPQDQFIEGVRGYAAELANMVSPRSLRVIKKQVYNGMFQTLAEATDSATEEMFQSLACADFREGVAHYLEKRPPAFTGK